MNDVTALAAIPSALQSATGAIQKNVKGIEKDAHTVANSNAVQSRETIEALLDSRQLVLYTQAAAKLISVSDEMQKSLVDIRA
jgi:hypothetical protein